MRRQFHVRLRSDGPFGDVAKKDCKIYSPFCRTAKLSPFLDPSLHVGRVEVRVGSSDRWAPVCGDGWGVREGMVSAVQHVNFFFPREHLIFQSQTGISKREKSSILNQLKIGSQKI